MTDEAPPLVEATDLTKHFDVSAPWLYRVLERRGRTILRAVDEVSFGIARGRALSLAGESGCGKSTVAKLVVGLHRSTAGTVRLAGDGIRRGAGVQMNFQDLPDLRRGNLRARRLVQAQVLNLMKDLRAPVESLCRIPRHPYTRLLLETIPGLGRPNRDRRPARCRARWHRRRAAPSTPVAGSPTGAAGPSGPACGRCPTAAASPATRSRRVGCRCRPGSRPERLSWSSTSRASGPSCATSCSSASSGARPIALVTSKGVDGVGNAAPMSLFSVFARTPPLLILGIQDRPSGRKDTVRNILDCGEFVVNLVDEAIAREMVVCSLDFPPEVDQVREAGLTLRPAVTVGCGRIAEAPVAFECLLERAVAFPGRHVICGEVTCMHVRESCIGPETLRMRPETCCPVARLHGDWYVSARDQYVLPRSTLDEWRRRKDVDGGEAAAAAAVSG